MSTIVDLSIIIPTKNRHEMLINVISSFFYQKFHSPIQIIIVDQTLFPLEKELLKKFEELIKSFDKNWVLNYFHVPEIEGLTQAKNYGINSAKGKYYLFLDDDVILFPGFFERILITFEEGFDAVSGVQIQDRTEKSVLTELYSKFFFRGYLKDRRRAVNRKYWKMPEIVPSNVLSGGITAYKAEIFKNLKFDENLKGYSLGEDKEFSTRLILSNYKLAINTKAYAFHFRHPKGKPTLFNRFESKVAFIYYLNRKVTTQKKLSIEARWALVGIFFEGIIKSLAAGNISPFKGIFSGIKKSKNGFIDLKYIRTEQ